MNTSFKVSNGKKKKQYKHKNYTLKKNKKQKQE